MHRNPDDEALRALLTSLRTIAVVGASDKPDRPVYGVMEFLQRQGVRTIPVNPRLARRQLLGETCYARLKYIPAELDMVDVFLNPSHLAPVVDDAIDIEAPVLWLQLGVVDEAAAARAAAAGLTVVMDRCPAIEFRRLGLVRQ